MAELGRRIGFRDDRGRAGDESMARWSARPRCAKLIAAGEMRTVARLLGRNHFLSGTVVHGRERGRTIGFPTANLDSETECLPPDGVYATRVILPDGAFASITNIGMRPTFAEPRAHRSRRTFSISIATSMGSNKARDRRTDPRRAQVRQRRRAEGADRARPQKSARNSRRGVAVSEFSDPLSAAATAGVLVNFSMKRSVSPRCLNTNQVRSSSG